MIASTLAVLVAFVQAPSPNYEVHSSGGKARTGKITSLSSDLAMTMEDGTKLPAASLIALCSATRVVPPWPREPHIELHNGDRLVGWPSGATDTHLPVRVGLMKPIDGANRDETIRIPLLSIARLWLKSPDRLNREKHPMIFEENRDTDQVVLSNGDLVRGTVTAIDSRNDTIEMEQGTQKRVISLSKAMVVAFSTRLARNRLPAGPYMKATLTNGTRVTLSEASILNGVLSGKTLYREHVEVPMAELLALDIHQGAAVYLSDIKPALYQYRAYQGDQFTWRADRDLRSRELQLQSTNSIYTFDKGLAVHGECVLEYALDGKFKRFESVVGLDPTSGKRGSVELQILIDGKPTTVGNGKPLTIQNGPWHVNADVRGAKTLTLKVLWGEGGHVGDYVNWGDARLIRNDAEKK